MGSCASTPSGANADPEASKRNAEIDRQLKQDAQAEKKQVKLLLLGAGESGKSTVLKQARLLYQGSYGSEEREEYISIVHANLVQSMQVVLEAVQTLGLDLASDDDKRAANRVLDYQLGDSPLAGSVASDIGRLWKDATVREAVRRKREFQLNDSAEYYFDAVDRLAKPGYVPTDDDILRSRVKTTGITETTFKVGELTWRLFDVGGQRSERRKWVHCFEGVNVLLFLIAVSEIDQTLYEDGVTNRLTEATTLFTSVVNSRWFAKTTPILFLNKIDLLRAKLANLKVHDHLPEYDGDNSFESVTSFFTQYYRDLYRGTKPFYTHLTCATDTKQISVVLAATNDAILRENLQHAGYL